MAMLTSLVRPSRHQRSHTSAACDVRQMRCVWKSILACGCVGSSLHVRLFHSLHSLRHVIMLPVVNALSVNTIAESLVLDYSRFCTTWHSKILSWPNVLHGITSDIRLALKTAVHQKNISAYAADPTEALIHNGAVAVSQTVIL